MLTNRVRFYWYPASHIIWRIEDELLQKWLEYTMNKQRLNEKALKTRTVSKGILKCV